MPECKECRWFAKGRAENVGLCRTGPPVLIQQGRFQGTGAWPEVRVDDWCAWFEEKKTP